MCAAMEARMGLMSVQLAAKEVKKKLLDSGANISIVSNLSHSDSNTFPTFLRADKPSVVETANISTMTIQGQGQFIGLNSVLCESANNSLLSASQFTRENDTIVIISEKDAVGVKLDSTVTSLLNDIKNTISIKINYYWLLPSIMITYMNSVM